MYVCIYVCTYICMYVYMYVCIYVYMYICMYICMYIYMYVSLYSVKLGVAQQVYEINKYIRSTSNGIERSKIIDKSRNHSGTVNSWNI